LWLCSTLKSLFLPLSLRFIESRAFLWSGLDEIQVAPGHPHFRQFGPLLITLSDLSVFYCFGTATSVMIPHHLLTLGFATFTAAQWLSWVSIPGSVTMIGARCFCACSSLQTVIFESHSAMRILGESAFHWCISLTAIFIPASVALIGPCCFAECSSLQDVTFEMGSQLGEIGSFAFSGCAVLTSIRIPASVGSIGDWSFYKCKSLVNLTFELGCRAKWGKQWLYRFPASCPYYRVCSPAAERWIVLVAAVTTILLVVLFCRH
jgi:hypothetical protein